jgi:hypothetical protein
MSSDLPGVNPATLNGILLYYRLMTKWSGLGDSTRLSRVGLSQAPIHSPLSGHLIGPSVVRHGNLSCKTWVQIPPFPIIIVFTFVWPGGNNNGLGNNDKIIIKLKLLLATLS